MAHVLNESDCITKEKNEYSSIQSVCFGKLELLCLQVVKFLLTKKSLKRKTVCCTIDGFRNAIVLIINATDITGLNSGTDENLVNPLTSKCNPRRY